MTTNESTWTCECGNVNTGDTCLPRFGVHTGCGKPRPTEITDEERDALLANNAGRDAAGWDSDKPWGEWEPECRRWLLGFYRSARAPLIEKHAREVEELSMRLEQYSAAIKGLHGQRDVHQQVSAATAERLERAQARIAELEAQAAKPKAPAPAGSTWYVSFVSDDGTECGCQEKASWYASPRTSTTGLPLRIVAEFPAASWEEAMKLHHRIAGFEPYRPMDAPAGEGPKLRGLEARMRQMDGMTRGEAPLPYHQEVLAAAREDFAELAEDAVKFEAGLIVDVAAKDNRIAELEALVVTVKERWEAEVQRQRGTIRELEAKCESNRKHMDFLNSEHWAAVNRGNVWKAFVGNLAEYEAEETSMMSDDFVRESVAKRVDELKATEMRGMVENTQSLVNALSKARDAEARLRELEAKLAEATARFAKLKSRREVEFRELIQACEMLGSTMARHKPTLGPYDDDNPLRCMHCGKPGPFDPPGPCTPGRDDESAKLAEAGKPAVVDSRLPEIGKTVEVALCNGEWSERKVNNHGKKDGVPAFSTVDDSWMYKLPGEGKYWRRIPSAQPQPAAQAASPGEVTMINSGKFWGELPGGTFAAIEADIRANLARAEERHQAEMFAKHQDYVRVAQALDHHVANRQRLTLYMEHQFGEACQSPDSPEEAAIRKIEELQAELARVTDKARVEVERHARDRETYLATLGGWERRVDEAEAEVERLRGELAKHEGYGG